MNEKTTNTSNDESRIEAKKEYVSDENIKNIIEQWNDGKMIYIAATDPEFLEKDIEENTSSSTTTGTGRKARRVKTTQAVIKNMRDLINYLNVTVGTKKQTEKVKEVRKKIAKINANKVKKAEQSEKNKQSNNREQI